MLFAIKRHSGPALFLALILALGYTAAAALGLAAPLAPPTARQWALAAACLGVIVASDGLVHGACSLAFRRTYPPRYRALVDYFAHQRALAIAAGGALAATEELVLRGVLLASARPVIGDAAAIAVAAAVFALLHVIPEPELAPFALWAAWEGALLGATYVATGSLLACALVHAAHDVGGFAVFAIQRRTGMLLPPRIPTP